MTLPLAAVNCVNQANRALLAVIGPALALEFGLSASGLGFLAASFFAAYALAQMPIGIALDLYGPRLVQVVLAAVAGCGFAISALAADAVMLGVGRFVSGAGLAAGLMAMIKANAQWYPAERVAAVTGAGLFLAGLGAMLATRPAQAALPWLGWRGMFGLLAVVSLLVALWIRRAVPEAPPGALAYRRRRLSEEAAEFGRIFGHAEFRRYVPAIMVVSGLSFTFQGLWAGPWLRDVAGLGDAPRATVLLFYALGLVVGSLAMGHATSLLQARGLPGMAVPAIGIAGMMAMQAVLIAGPREPVALSALWFAFAFAAAVGPPSYAVVGQRFPPELAGRVATAINAAMLALVFFLQNAIGWVLDLWPRLPDGGWHPAGYGWALGMTLLLQGASALWMVLAPRHAPRGGGR